MGRLDILWLFLLLAIFNTQIFSVAAVSKTYDWNVYRNTHYEVLVFSESPQLDKTFEITVRLTLLSKDWSLDHTKTEWMQVLVSSTDRSISLDSGKQEQTVFLNETGASWQRTFPFQISSSQYGIARGQSIRLSVVYKISIYEFDNVQDQYWNSIGDNINNPVIINLSIPLLSTYEAVILLIIIAIVISILARSAYLGIKNRRIRSKERLRKEAEEKRKEKILGENFECPFCHTLYDKRLDKCPTCGAAKKIRD